MKKRMKNLFLIALVTLVVPFAVNAEETNTESTTTTDDTAAVKLYETDENGKEIKLSNPIKNGDKYVYNATITSESNITYYLEVKPNYEYDSIEYSATSNGVLEAFKLSSSISPYYISDCYLYSGELVAKVVKKDGSEVTYVVSALKKDATVYVGDETKEPIAQEEPKTD